MLDCTSTRWLSSSSSLISCLVLIYFSPPCLNRIVEDSLTALSGCMGTPACLCSKNTLHVPQSYICDHFDVTQQVYTASGLARRPEPSPCQCFCWIRSRLHLPSAPTSSILCFLQLSFVHFYWFLKDIQF